MQQQLEYDLQKSLEKVEQLQQEVLRQQQQLALERRPGEQQQQQQHLKASPDLATLVGLTALAWTAGVLSAVLALLVALL